MDEYVVLMYSTRSHFPPYLSRKTQYSIVTRLVLSVTPDFDASAFASDRIKAISSCSTCVIGPPCGTQPASVGCKSGKR
jgi:hypothetical protein